MSTLRIPLNQKSVDRLNALAQQMRAFEDAHNAIVTGILDALDVTVAKDARVTRDGNDLVVTTDGALFTPDE